MKPKPVSIFVTAILLLSLVTGLIACTGETAPSPTSPSRSTVSSTTAVDVDVTSPASSPDGIYNEDLSTFESKDPFIQQVTATHDPVLDHHVQPHHHTLLQHAHDVVDYYHQEARDHDDDQTGHYYHNGRVRPHAQDPFRRQGR